MSDVVEDIKTPEEKLAEINVIKVKVFDLLVEIELLTKDLRSKEQAKNKLLQQLEELKKV